MVVILTIVGAKCERPSPGPPRARSGRSAAVRAERGAACASVSEQASRGTRWLVAQRCMPTMPAGVRLRGMYLGTVTRRSRILAFGSAAVVVLAGAACAALVGGLTGQLLTIVLMSLGLGGAVLLMFLEVGLSEDRERAREAESRRKPPALRPDHQARRRLRRVPRRPS